MQMIHCAGYDKILNSTPEESIQSPEPAPNNDHRFETQPREENIDDEDEKNLQIAIKESLLSQNLSQLEIDKIVQQNEENLLRAVQSSIEEGKKSESSFRSDEEQTLLLFDTNQEQRRPSFREDIQNRPSNLDIERAQANFRLGMKQEEPHFEDIQQAGPRFREDIQLEAQTEEAAIELAIQRSLIDSENSAKEELRQQDIRELFQGLKSPTLGKKDLIKENENLLTSLRQLDSENSAKAEAKEEVLLIDFNSSLEEPLASSTPREFQKTFSFPLINPRPIPCSYSMLRRMSKTLDSSVERLRTLYKIPSLISGTPDYRLSTNNKEIYDRIAKEGYSVLDAMRMQIMHSPEIFALYSCMKSAKTNSQDNYAKTLLDQITPNTPLEAILAKNIEKHVIPIGMEDHFLRHAVAYKSAKDDIKHTSYRLLSTLGKQSIKDCVQLCEESAKDIIRSGPNPLEDTALAERIKEMSLKIVCFYSAGVSELDLNSSGEFHTLYKEYPKGEIIAAHLIERTLLKYVDQVKEANS